MGTNGIGGLYLETHNWGKTVAFWIGLGFELEFETDHHSGQLSHQGGGPWIFVAERPEGDALETYPIVLTDDAASFEPPASGTVDSPFTPRHWSVVELLLHDPDARHVSVQAPLPEGVDAPPGHD